MNNSTQSIVELLLLYFSAACILFLFYWLICDMHVAIVVTPYVMLAKISIDFLFDGKK